MKKELKFRWDVFKIQQRLCNVYVLYLYDTSGFKLLNLMPCFPIRIQLPHIEQWLSTNFHHLVRRVAISGHVMFTFFHYCKKSSQEILTINQRHFHRFTTSTKFKLWMLIKSRKFVDTWMLSCKNQKFHCAALLHHSSYTVQICICSVHCTNHSDED